MGEYTDIKAGGWVARLPPGVRPYALLARLDRPIGAWLLFLPGLWSLCLTARGWRLATLVALFALGSVLMRGAGCVVNDIWDRDLDRKVPRTAGRPLAAGTLRLPQAVAFLAALLLLSLAVLLALNRPAQACGAASLLLVALYPLAKRVTWWPQAMLGLTFGWGAPMGMLAGACGAGGMLSVAGGAWVIPGGGRLLPVALALYGAAICWIIGYDTIYAHQDRHDDALIGVRSTARLFAGHTRGFLLACYGAAVALLCLAGWLARLHGGFYLGVALAAGMLGWQVWVIDIDNPALCLRLFKANREVGLVVAAAILAGSW